MQSEFKPKYGAKAQTAAAHAFDRQFGSRLKYHMEYCINNPGEISKIHRVKAKVDEVKGIMVQNIEKVRLMPDSGWSINRPDANSTVGEKKPTAVHVLPSRTFHPYRQCHREVHL